MKSASDDMLYVKFCGGGGFSGGVVFSIGGGSVGGENSGTGGGEV